MLRRSLVFALLIGLLAVATACKRRYQVSQQTIQAQQTQPISDNSAEVSATLPFFHRLDETYTRGGEPARGGIETLKRLGIKAVVDLRSDYDYTPELGIATEHSGLTYYRRPTSVWDPPTDQEAKDFVALVSDKTKGPFYVFCADGVNRVGEMSAIYRVAYSKWSVANALKEIDAMGFNPYYYNLRGYVYTYARKFHPKALPPQARALSSMEL